MEVVDIPQKVGPHTHNLDHKITHKTSQQPVFPSAYGYREGNAGMWGLLGFFLAVFPNSLLEFVSPNSSQQSIWPFLTVFGGFLQLQAGYYDFKHGNSFTSSIFTVFGWHWIAKGLLEGQLSVLESKNPASSVDITYSLGIYLVSLTIVNTVFCLLAWNHPRGSYLLVVTLVAVDLKLLLNSINVWVKSVHLHQTAGFFGSLGALLALYSYIAESYAEEGIILPTWKYHDQTVTRVVYDPKWKIRKQM